MATKGQSFWGMAGASTNAYIVSPQRQKQLYMKAYLSTLVGKINGLSGNKIRQMGEAIIETRGGGKMKIDIGNDSPIWERVIQVGNEYRMTMLEEEKGLAGSYGDASVTPGPYASYRHMVAYVNQIDSKATPLPGRCSLKQVRDIISNPKGDLMMNKMRWASEEVDAEFFRALIMGASRNLLHDQDEGGLEITLYGASAGQTRSCYNFYVPGGGLITPSVTRATHETNVGTALSTLTDVLSDNFDYEETQIISDMVKTKKFTPVSFGGMKLRAAVLCDPDLMYRLTHSAGDYVGLAKYALERGKENPSLNHMNPVIIDEIMYLSAEWLKAFRPTVTGGVPVYNKNLNTDPRDDTTASKLCLAVVMGAGAVVRGTDMSIDVTVEEAKHKKGMEYAAHWDDGFVRREEFTKDSRTELENSSSIVCAYYDPGVGAVSSAG